MRKINSLAGHVDPDVLFAQGAKRIIKEKTRFPTNYRDYELDAILRKERALAMSNKTRSRSFSSRIAEVLNVFVWHTSPDSMSRLARSIYFREHRMG